MFIEKRKNGKVYLTHSVRIKNKVRKVRVYLGKNLTRRQIESKRKQAEKTVKSRVKSLRKIRDPYSTALSSEEIEQVKSLEAKGSIKIKHLDERQWEKFTEEFTYDTNAIEGSTVKKGEVKDILEKDTKPEYRKDWEIQETHGVAAAVRHIRKTKTHISLALIKKLHKLCFKNSKSFAGKLREKGQEVVVVGRNGRVVHRGAPSEKVEFLLNKLINWYKTNKEQYPALVLAVAVHNQFEDIHPFADGNGRVGRLILNNILLKHNKPPVNIDFENREEYYAALREYQKEGNMRPMLELIIKEYKNLKKFLG